MRVVCGCGCVDAVTEIALREGKAADAAVAGTELAATIAGCVATFASALGGCTCVLAILAAALVRALRRTNVVMEATRAAGAMRGLRKSVRANTRVVCIRPPTGKQGAKGRDGGARN